MIVEPSDQERATWPDATRAYVEEIEERNKVLRIKNFEAKTMSEIKDCPWCDKIPEVLETMGDGTTLICTNLDCEVRPRTKQPTKLEAILAWNRRNSSLELTADHCDYYEQELIPQLKTKITKHLRLAEHWSAGYTSLCEELSNIETLRDLVETYFYVHKIGCECCTVSNCGECMVCLILKYFVGEKNVEKQDT